MKTPPELPRDQDPPEYNAAAEPVRRRGLLARMRRGRRPVEVAVSPREEGSVVQLKKGYNEIVETMSAVRTHMEQQSERSAQMLEILEQLPTTLRHSADASQAQTRVLETIHESLRGQNQTQTELSRALSGLAGATQQQEKAVDGVRGELAAQRQQHQHAMTGLADTLGDVTQASKANAEALRAVTTRAETADRHTLELFEKSRRSATAVAAISWAAAALVLLVSVFMFMELQSRNGITGTAADPAPQAGVDDATPDNPTDSATALAESGPAVEAEQLEPETASTAPDAPPDTADAGESADATDAVADAPGAPPTPEAAADDPPGAAEAGPEVTDPRADELADAPTPKPADATPPGRILPDRFDAPAENQPAPGTPDAVQPEGEPAILGA